MSECTHSYGWCSRCGQYVDGPALLAARDARIAELEREVENQKQSRQRALMERGHAIDAMARAQANAPDCSCSCGECWDPKQTQAHREQHGQELNHLREKAAQLTRERDEAGAELPRAEDQIIKLFAQVGEWRRKAKKAHAAGFAACREMAAKEARAGGCGCNHAPCAHDEAGESIAARITTLKPQGGNDGEVG